ncbi:predicted protein, partial [Nematostella vectensis]
MARRVSRTALENEIERARVEGRWESLSKLVEQLCTRTTQESQIDSLKILLLAEADLETYSRDHSLDVNDLRAARSALEPVVTKLNNVIQERKKDERSQEAMLLLCKAYFIQGEFQSSVQCCNEAGADDLVIDMHFKRKSRLVAEAFAYKAMALEELKLTGKDEIQEDDIISCYEYAGDIAIWLMAGQKASFAQTYVIGEMSQAIEVAIQRAPILHIKNGRLTQGINRFRQMLQALESKATHNLRKILAQQLAQVLVRGVCERTYEKPNYQNTNIPGSIVSLSRGAGKPEAGKSTAINVMMTRLNSFPLKPLVYASDSLFIPRDEIEEALLLLLLEDSMVLRDAVLSVAPAKAAARSRTVSEANTVYDLLTIALTRRAQYGMLVECLDKGMKLAYEEFHLWFQFALSLISAGKYQRALLVLRQCACLKPDDPLVPLYAAKLCFNHLHQLEEGVGFAKQVVAMGDDNEWASRAYQALGVGYAMQAVEASLSADRQRLHKLAIDALESAHAHDPEDADILFHLALAQAHTRQISRAVKNTCAALKIEGDNLRFLHLMALLLSAQKKFSEALDMCEAALMEYPDDFSLLLTKVKLEEICIGSDQALITCKQLLETWKQVYDSELSSGDMRRAGSGLLDKVIADTRSLKQIPLTEISSEKDGDPETGSIAASVRLEQALSDEAASASIGKLSVSAVLALQSKIWLAIAGVFIGAGKDAEANACIQEANLIFPLSPDVLYQRGRVFEIRGGLNDAKTCYTNAISINPSHAPSMERLGVVYQKLNNLVMAEKMLRETINVDPTVHAAWHHLGTVLEEQGEHEAASECLFTSADLEATCPILGFTTIP